MPDPTCAVPAPNAARNEDKIREFLHQKAPGLALLYDAARIARHYAALPGIGLILAHLVREIHNGLVNVVLGQASKTQPQDVLKAIGVDWSTVAKSLSTLAPALGDSPERQLFEKAAAAINKAFREYMGADQGARKRAALMFEALTGLPGEAEDPTPGAWSDNAKAAVGIAHFQASTGTLPLSNASIAQLETLEIHLNGLRAGAAEGLDLVEQLVEELQRDA